MIAKVRQLDNGLYRVNAKMPEEGISLTATGLTSSQMWRVLSCICDQIEVVKTPEEAEAVNG